MYMSLKNKDKGSVIAIETTEILDTVYDEINISQENDMLAYIQIPKLDKGLYELEISVPKGHWTYTR